MNETVLFLTIFVAAGIIFDVYIIAKKGKSESISAHIIRGSKKYPLLVYCAGVLTGHLLWSMDTFDWMDKNQLETKCEKVLTP